MSFVKSIVICTMALSLLCGFAFAQPQSDKPKAAVYIKGNPQGRDVLRMAVNTFLVKTGRYQMIAVDAIDLIAQEQKRQMGGAVSDDEIAKIGRDAGARYVCVVERSEMDGISYVTTSMVNVQSKIAEFSDMKELPRGERVINIIERQINAMLGISSEEERVVYDAVSEPPSQRQPPSVAVTYLRVNGQNEASVSFGPAGGMKTFTVSTDGVDYDISFMPAWCSADKYGASFSLTCTPNQTSSDRDDWFNVASGDKTVRVLVSQSSSGSAAGSRQAKPKRERTPKPKRPKNQSMGVGGLFASDVGGGVTWNEGDRQAELSMPYYGGGFYVFWDWVYLEIFGGMHWGGGKWKSADVGDLPDMSRTYGDYGVFGKFPLIGIGQHVTLFPLYGVDYEVFKNDTTTATLRYANKNQDVSFNGKGDNPHEKTMNALWGKVGGGIDIGGPNNNLYFFLRVEGLYGIRFKANDFEKYRAVDYIGSDDGQSKQRGDVKPIPGRGLTVRVSVGFQ